MPQLPKARFCIVHPVLSKWSPVWVWPQKTNRPSLHLMRAQVAALKIPIVVVTMSEGGNSAMAKTNSDSNVWMEDSPGWYTVITQPRLSERLEWLFGGTPLRIGKREQALEYLEYFLWIVLSQSHPQSKHLEKRKGSRRMLSAHIWGRLGLRHCRICPSLIFTTTIIISTAGALVGLDF